MAKLEAGMTRVQAFALLQEHNKDPFHIEHGETVEQTMRYFAREFDPENEEFWGIVGLLHDLDWEEHDDEPEQHTVYAAKDIEAAGGTPELVRAIQSHTSDFNPALPKPELQMDEDPVRHRGADGPHRRRHRHAPEQERHGLRGEVAQEEVQGQALRRRREPRRHPLRCRHARLGAGTSCSPAPSRPCSPSLPIATPSSLRKRSPRKRLDAARHTQQGDRWRKPCPETGRGGGLCIRLPACAHR